MKVITLLRQGDLKSRLEQALVQDQYVVEQSVSPFDCLIFSRLSQYDCAIIECEAFADQEVLTLVKMLRSERPSMALFVLARHLDLEKRKSLFEAGLDDVVSEPFFAAELAVRLKHIIALRQAVALTDLKSHVLRAGDLQMDLLKRTVTRQSKQIDLRPREFMLLEYLLRNANRLVTRTMILEHVWNSSYEGLTNVVDVYVSALRNKLDRNFPKKLIQTNGGQGYTLVCLKRDLLQMHDKRCANKRIRDRKSRENPPTPS
jgi:two-component system OmpR family response regulator